MRMTSEHDLIAPPRGRQVLGLHPIRWTGIATLAVVFVLWNGYHRVPTEPAQGDALAGNATPFSGQTFRVGTFNIDGGVGGDKKLDLVRTADSMVLCDLVGLQEVHGRTLTDSRDQAHILGDNTHLPWLYAPSERRWWHDYFGNAVLSRLPIESWQRLPVSSAASTNNRSILIAHFRIGGALLHVLIVHLPTTNDRASQCAIVSELFFAMQKPAVLMGDLNAKPGDAWIEKVRNHADVVDAVGEFAEKDQPQHVDWIFARGLECTGGGAIDRHASDHPFYWAEFKTPNGEALPGIAPSAATAPH